MDVQRPAQRTVFIFGTFRASLKFWGELNSPADLNVQLNALRDTLCSEINQLHAAPLLEGPPPLLALTEGVDDATDPDLPADEAREPLPPREKGGSVVDAEGEDTDQVAR
eukprot:667865-Prorocentrum_minimum.AAC.1